MQKKKKKLVEPKKNENNNPVTLFKAFNEKEKKNKDKNEKLIILKMFIKNTLFFTKIVIK